MLRTNFSPWPNYSEQECSKVSEILASNKVNYWTGSECREFEREFAEFADSDHAVAVVNGTVALDLAWIALDIGLGDEVIVTARTYLASASSIALSGAIPIFADVDLDTQNITPESVRALITSKTKAICCVHLAGWPCDMVGFRELADEFGLFLVEDCAQAHGAKISGRSVGSFGDVSAWSFCQDKIMTTGGEGGMVTTNDESLWRRIWEYKDHGKSYEKISKQNPKEQSGFKWIHDSLGTNWRMPEMQAAIGRIQLTLMTEWNDARARHAEAIINSVQAITCVRASQPTNEFKHAWYKCYLFVKPKKLAAGHSRDTIMKAIWEQGVPCYSGSCPEVYLEKAFTDKQLAPATRLPNSKLLGETSLMFLIHPNLTELEIQKTCNAITRALNNAQLRIPATMTSSHINAH